MENSLSNKRPELAPEWSPRNGTLTPDNISYGSNKVVWWSGSCDHEWQASVKSRSAGENCPICSGARVIEGINDLQTLYPELAEEWSPKNYPLKPTAVSAGSHKRVIWLGACGHEWTAIVKSRVQGTGCPFCSHNLVLPGFNDLATLFPEVAAEWSEKNLPLRPNMITAYTNRKVWWKCSNGHEWNTLVSTRAYGSKCPYCSGIRILKGFNDFATTHPEIAGEWSDRNLPLTPDAVNEKSQKNVWWKCKTCGFEWKSLIKSRVKGTICPVCADRAVLPGYNDLATTDPELAREWDVEMNRRTEPTAISRNSLRSVWWKCPCGHSWKARVRDRAVDGTGCTCCEKEFYKVMPQLLVMLYAGQKGLQVLVNSDREIGVSLETYIPELNFAIESSDTISTEAKALALIKNYICSKRGIKLVQVPYKKGEDQAIYARKIKRAFQKAHVYISSDEREDIDLIHTKFSAWKVKEAHPIEKKENL